MYLNDGTIKIANSKLNKLIEEYSFYLISEKSELDISKSINKNIKKSKIILFYRCLLDDQFYFIIVFKKTLSIISQSSFSILQSLFVNNQRLSIYFVSDSYQDFNNIKIPNSQFEHKAKYNDEIKKFLFNFRFIKNKNFPKDNETLIPNYLLSISCIARYLIEESFIKLKEQQKSIFF